jgi:signal transduction histidine kinase
VRALRPHLSVPVPWGRSAARDFFNQNETIILFSQGLVFFSLGFAVWLQRRRATRLTLSSSLIWLAAFAFVEALAVWGHVFIPIQDGYLSDGMIEGLEVVRATIQVAAFVFLVQFGLRLIDMPPVVRRSLTALSVLVAIGILGGCALAAGSTQWGAAEWEQAATALARYTLLFPGALLSAVGLWRQRAELSDAGMPGIKPYAGAAAGVLALYAVIGGLIVPPGPISPGGVGDADGWFDLTGLPLEVILGAVGLVLCVLAVKLLEIFDVEAKQQLEALDRARAIAEERARFRRDLHDGTIQSIYAAGLHLEAIAIRSDDDAVRSEVRGVVADLNDATDRLRDYIRALAQPPATPQGIATDLGELTKRFADETGREVRFSARGMGASGPLPDEASQHLEQILREALSNTARHAGACKVAVSLVFAPDELDLVVSDDGCGPHRQDEPPTPGRHEGLRNMSERARRLGGRIAVEEAPGGGTNVTLAVPLDSDVPEDEPFAIESDREVSRS